MTAPAVVQRFEPQLPDKAAVSPGEKRVSGAGSDLKADDATFREFPNPPIKEQGERPGMVVPNHPDRGGTQERGFSAAVSTGEDAPAGFRQRDRRLRGAPGKAADVLNFEFLKVHRRSATIRRSRRGHSSPRGRAT